MHRYIQKTPSDFDLNLGVVATLFATHKYEITDNMCYKASTMAEMFLLPPAADVQEKETRRYDAMMMVRDEEIRLLDTVDFKLESVSAYNFIHVYGGTVKLGPISRHLTHYLITIASYFAESFGYLPSMLASAAVSIALSLE